MNDYLKNQGSILANYFLVGTTWLEANTLEPGRDDLNEDALGGIQLANAVMETYSQGPQSADNKPANCFGCHNTAADTTNGLPAKNINISHAILNPLIAELSAGEDDGEE